MIYEKLVQIQQTLKAPKSEFNKFGGYNYRSCEGILEAVKPLLAEHNLALVLTDEIVPVADRIYVRATAKLFESGGEDLAFITTSAYAREEDAKKGMDASQVTGTASSYARKYALNGLFCIDDAKDSDYTNQEEKKPVEKPRFICDKCGKELHPYKDGKGNTVSLRAHVERSTNRFGKILCLDCITDAMAYESENS